ncbi:NAD(P)H-dependent flavin oxidoreductase [Oceanospirillum sp.]|uniref:NAD(P)H-dependent flavin oxidoreductase n=1 Tax=Oceanospirillum sp. TaxID=2021254 RepID=UPI003A9375B1
MPTSVLQPSAAFLQKMLRFPLWQAPMAGSQDSVLAIAVSDAGGLGAIPCAMLSPEQVRSALALVKEKTKRPVNVNFFCHNPPESNETEQAAWLEALQPYYAEMGLDPLAVPAGSGRQPFSEAYLEAIRPYQPEVVSFHFGLPDQALIAEIKAWGGLIASTATTVEEGIWLQERGADFVIAQGLEAGGHRGHFLTADLECQLPVRFLVTELVSKVDLPMIAAGGIATGDDIAELLSLGASAVQLGTAFLLTPEAKTTDLHRQALKSDLVDKTSVTNLFSGRPARGMVNRLMEELGPISPQAPAFPLASQAIAPLRAAAEQQGRWDFSPLWCGESAGKCRELPVAELIHWLTAKL